MKFSRGSCQRVGFTVAYGILMLWLWPNEIVSSEGSPERLVP